MMDPDIQRRLQAAVAASPQAPALPEALHERLAEQARAACLGDALAGLRPEMQAMTLLALAGREIGLDPAYGIDGFLAGFARGLGKTVMSLESPEFQVGLMVRNDAAGTARLVSETLDELTQWQCPQVDVAPGTRLGHQCAG